MNRMKSLKKICRIIFPVIVFSMILFACGGGGSDKSASSDNDSHWDSMVWDQGEWG